MNKVKVLLEEILPLYFLLMAILVIFTSYIPTSFELFILYAYSFGVMVFNNRLYKQNTNLLEYVDMFDDLQNENVELRKKLAQKHYGMEVMK